MLDNMESLGCLTQVATSCNTQCARLQRELVLSVSNGKTVYCAAQCIQNAERKHKIWYMISNISAWKLKVVALMTMWSLLDRVYNTLWPPLPTPSLLQYYELLFCLLGFTTQRLRWRIQNFYLAARVRVAWFLYL